MKLRYKQPFFNWLAQLFQKVSGIPPLTMPRAVAGRLKKVTAYGGCALNGIPAEYTEVIYVERPSGNTEQCIETSWKPNLAKNIAVYGRAAYLGDVTSYKPILLGNYTGTRSSTLNIEFDGRTANNFRVYTLKANAASGADLQVGPFALNDIVDFSLEITGATGTLAVTASANGTTVTGSGTVENIGEQTLYNMMLFKDHRATTTSASKVPVRIYYLKVTEDGREVLDLVPVKRNSDALVGFFDRVSKTFLFNSGTGSLVAGPAVTPSPDSPCEIWCNNGALKVLDKSSWTIFTNPTSIAGQGVYISPTGLWYAVNDRGAGCAIPLVVGKSYILSIYKHTATLGTMLRYGQSPQAAPTAQSVQLVDWYRGGSPVDGQVISFTAKLPYLVMQLSADAVESGMIQEAIEVVEASGDQETLKISPYIDNNSSTATTEMLLKLGNYVDSQDILNGIVNRQLGIKVFRGTENFSTATRAYIKSDACDAFWLSNTAYLEVQKVGTPTVICSHLKFVNKTVWNLVGYPNSVGTYSSDTNYLQIHLNISNDVLGIADYTQETMSTVSQKVKAWVLNLYNNGTPLIVVFPLKNPTSSPTTPQPLTVVEGNNTLEVTQASLTDLELFAEYKRH